jgi:hypothetical protein
MSNTKSSTIPLGVENKMAQTNTKNFCSASRDRLFLALLGRDPTFLYSLQSLKMWTFGSIPKQAEQEITKARREV